MTVRTTQKNKLLETPKCRNWKDNQYNDFLMESCYEQEESHNVCRF